MISNLLKPVRVLIVPSLKNHLILLSGLCQIVFYDLKFNYSITLPKRYNLNRIDFLYNR